MTIRRFATEHEVSARYLLDDGTEIHARLVLMGVERVEGKWTPEGAPYYEMRWQHLVDVRPTDELLAEGKAAVGEQK